MVFSSVPAYLDHPNWNQQQPLHQLPAAGAAGGDASHQLLPGLGAARSEAAMAAAAGGGGAARAISMTERARMAKIVPQPEQPLKCPRCDSTNTKFCYFNNYSLTQPRHFCKTCRRYWTRGGALRNVPVGGGCRRNKRSKSSSGGGSGGGSSKSTVIASAAADRQAAGASSSSSTAGGRGGGVIPASITHPGQLPFLTSMHTLAGGDYGAPNLGLNFPGIPSIDAAEYQAANSSSSTVGLDQWRLQQIQQFPFLGAMEPPPPPQALYHFSVDGTAASRVLPKVSGSSLITQLASVKMEDSHLPRHYLGLAGNEQYNWSSTNTGEGGSSSSAGWGTTTDLSGFNTSSSGNIL